MLQLGQAFPDFKLKGVISADSQAEFIDVNQTSYPDKWTVVFFWPKDFTFVCPTEIAEFGRLHPELKKRDVNVLGASIDTEFVHMAWRKQPPDLKDLPFRMLADVKRELSVALGILDPQEGVSQRATYVIDP